jgi:hypothetical protein
MNDEEGIAVRFPVGTRVFSAQRSDVVLLSGAEVSSSPLKVSVECCLAARRDSCTRLYGFVSTDSAVTACR